MASSEQFGEIRSLLHEPSASSWEQIWDLLLGWDTEELEGKVLPYIHGHIDNWPLELQILPPAHLDLLRDSPEHPALELVHCARFRRLSAGTIASWGWASLRWSSVEKFRLEECHLSASDWAALRQAGGLQLEAFELVDCPMNADDARALCQTLRRRKPAQLLLAGCQFAPTGVELLAYEESVLRGLKSLQISRDRVGDAQTEALAAAAGIESLRRLDLNTNHVGSQGLAAIARSDRMRGLRSLVLHHNSVDGLGLRSLVDARMRSLCELDLSYNFLDDASVMYMAEQLEGLERLTIGGNALGAQAAAAIASSPILPEDTRARWRER